MMRWLLCAWCAAVVALEGDGDAARCLSDASTFCNATAMCPSAFSRACLSTPVPWRTPYARVRCCLRCCLLHHVEALGLGRNFRANAAAFAAEKKAPPREDEMALGFGLESTMAFAALRKPLKGTGGKESLVPGADLWAPAIAAPGGGDPLWGPSSWVDVAFGDGCASFAGYDFGKTRRAHLTQIITKVLAKHRAAVVSTDDCDAPDGGVSSALLAHDNLRAWFASNPAPGYTHPKLAAFPIGAHDRGAFVDALERAEARGADRSTLLVCCCMASLPPPGARKSAYPGLAPAAAYKGMKADTKAALNNASLLLGGAAAFDGFAKTLHVTVAQVARRVRRTAVIDALKASGFTGCSYGALQSARGTDHHAAYVDRLAAASFVASPRGNGRACHRDWEALYAGAIPLVDWDASSAMADLYDGLPVVRVRDWREVTPAFLEATRRDFEARSFDVQKLYAPHWLRRLTSAGFPGEA